MSIAEKLTAIAENEQRVYDSGVDEGEGNIWDEIQGVNGKRTDYDCFFRRWQSDYIRPKYKVVPQRGTGTIDKNLRSVFEDAKIKKIESEYFDFSNMVFDASTDTTNCLYAFFRRCSLLEEIEDIGLKAGGYYQTFNRCPKLHTIAVMRCVKDGTYNGPFTQCYELANITIEGEIGKSITFQYSPKLTVESLTAPETPYKTLFKGEEITEMRMGLFRALYDFSGTDEEYTQTLTLNSETIAMLDNNNVTIDGVPWRVYITEGKKWNVA